MNNNTVVLGHPSHVRSTVMDPKTRAITKMEEVGWYEIVGLPQGQRIFIANLNINRPSWVIGRCRGSKTDWSGGFNSAEEALANYRATAQDFDF